MEFLIDRLSTRLLQAVLLCFARWTSTYTTPHSVLTLNHFYADHCTVSLVYRIMSGVQSVIIDVGATFVATTSPENVQEMLNNESVQALANSQTVLKVRNSVFESYDVAFQNIQFFLSYIQFFNAGLANNCNDTSNVGNWQFNAYC